jgi:hypothetical protein
MHRIVMNKKEALAYIQKHGVVLASARGSVPRLTEAIVNGPIRGSWWSHPKSREIFSILQYVVDSEDVLVCRLVDGKITFVHRRLWPALVRAAGRFPSSQVSKVREEHTSSGKHVTHEIPFPEWVPSEIRQAAKQLTEEDALIALGSWASEYLDPGNPKPMEKRKKK